MLVLVLQRLAVSVDIVAEVDRMTRGQRNNQLWSVLHAGRLTASKFGDVLRACRRKRTPPSLLSSLLGEYNLEGVKAVQWGIEHEQQAVDSYVSAFSVHVSEVGLLLHESGVLGASPDRYEEPDGLLEVKCPFSSRHKSIPELLQDDKFCIAPDQSGGYKLKTDHIYYDQCQGQMCISGRKRLSFYVWLPESSLRVEVLHDEEWERVNIPLLIDFYFRELFPAYIRKCGLSE
jgi:hypothetical protein